MARKQRSTKWAMAIITRAALVLLIAATIPQFLKAQDSPTTSDAVTAGSQSTQANVNASPALPRGKKLILKNGEVQLVREYQVQGDRVRFYSIDRSQWEVIPTDLVDWDATKKAEAADAQGDAALLAKVKKEENERNPEMLDIDASLEVAPGIYLPPGDHLFIFDGKAVLPLAQAETTTALSKRRAVEKVMVPVPIVPSRHSVSIEGPHAKLRVRSDRPEFYIRTADAREPSIELIQAKIKGDKRQVENLDQLFGQQEAVRDEIPMQRWTVANGVFRFTLGKALEPGEYVLAESVPNEGMSLYVWDFGVDPNDATPKTIP